MGYGQSSSVSMGAIWILCFGVSACEPLPSGDLTIEYLFEGQTCSAAGVDGIQIDVQGQVQHDGYSALVSCWSAPIGVTVPSLAVDTYNVYVDGLSASGAVLYGMDLPVQLRVAAGRDSAYQIDVGATVGTLTLYWTFGGSGVCGAVYQVRVIASDPWGIPYDDALYPCSDTGVVYDDVASGTWTVTMMGIDAQGAILYQAAQRTVEVAAGFDNQYSIDLQ